MRRARPTKRRNQRLETECAQTAMEHLLSLTERGYKLRIDHQPLRIGEFSIRRLPGMGVRIRWNEGRATP